MASEGIFASFRYDGDCRRNRSRTDFWYKELVECGWGLSWGLRCRGWSKVGCGRSAGGGSAAA